MTHKKKVGVVLAAGEGKRLRPLTLKTPKCLVNVLGKPILHYQLEAFCNAGISPVIVVTGHLSYKVREFIHEYAPHPDVVIVENPNYKETNNMYSFDIAYDYLKENENVREIFLINGDVIVTPELMIYATNKIGSRVFIDRSIYLSESMKVKAKEGRVVDISKDINENEAYGVSIDLYKLQSEQAEILHNIVEDYVNRGIVNNWTEIAIQKGVHDGLLRLKTCDITGYVWWEIDNFEDLRRAEYRLSLIHI